MAKQLNESEYIAEARGDLKLRYSRMCEIINALELRIIDEAANNSTIEEYDVNSGQTKIRTKYRSVESMAAAIEGFEKLKTKIENKLNGRVMVARPWQGLC